MVLYFPFAGSGLTFLSSPIHLSFLQLFLDSKYCHCCCFLFFLSCEFIPFRKIQGRHVSWQLSFLVAFFQTGWAGEGSWLSVYLEHYCHREAIVSKRSTFASFPWGLSVLKGSFSLEAKQDLVPNWASLTPLSYSKSSGQAFFIESVQKYWK